MQLTNKWREQFSKPWIRPMDVMKLISKKADVGFQFKINFLVLFLNLMADCTSMGRCNTSFLSKIKSEDMIPNINWCKYVYEKVRKSKELWRRESESCFYTGPLTYLTLLYVEATKNNKDEVPLLNMQLVLGVWHI